MSKGTLDGEIILDYLGRPSLITWTLYKGSTRVKVKKRRPVMMEAEGGKITMWGDEPRNDSQPLMWKRQRNRFSSEISNKKPDFGLLTSSTIRERNVCCVKPLSLW